MNGPYVAPDDHRDYRRARIGELPAEALPTYLRWALVAELVDLGLTDLAISQLTSMTLYTTARIRDSLSLPPNQRPGTQVA